MSIVGATRPDTSGDNERATLGHPGVEHPADDCGRPVRVTVRLDNNIPESCHHHDSGPADTGCATRAEHDHRRRSWPNPPGKLVLDRGTTLRATLVLIALLGGLATMALGVVGGIGASAGLLLTSLGALILRRRSAPRAQRENA
jgi:hypothetical protein